MYGQGGRPSGPVLPEPESIPAEQVHALDRGLISAGSSAPIAAFSAYVLDGGVPGQWLALWVLAVTAIVAIRISVAAGLRRCAPNPARDLLLHTIGACAGGAAWGALALHFLDAGTITEHAFLGFVVAGVTAGGLPTLSWHLPAYLGFLLSATLPLVTTYFADFNRLTLVMGSLVLLYSALMSLAARYFNGRILAVLRLQNEVATLGRNLAATQEELALAEKTKWRMLGHLSHELRTPMNAVLGFSEMIETQVYGPLGDPRYQEYIGIVRRSGRQVFELMSEILELSQAEAGSLQVALAPVEIADLVVATVAEYAERAKANGVTLRILRVDPLPPLQADGGKLQRSLGHLLANAIRFTPKGGVIDVAIERQSAGWAVIRVTDSGIGMDAKMINHALHPFGRLDSPLTKQHSGVGVGLPLTKRLVEIHGGRLEIESQPSKGTTVRMVLPFQSVPASLGQLKVEPPEDLLKTALG